MVTASSCQTVLDDPESGAQQHLDGPQTSSRLWLAAVRSSFAAAASSSALGSWVVLAGQVAGEHRHLHRRLIPAPLVDADEEHPQGAEPVRQGGVW